MVFTAQIGHQDIKKYFKHMDDVFTLGAAPELITSGVYPNAKEYAESCGAYKAYFKYLHRRIKPLYEDFSDCSRVHVYCVGDGRSPRTGTMFALRSPYRVFSIDPNMNTDKYVHVFYPRSQRSMTEWSGQRVFGTHVQVSVERLTCHKTKIEQFKQDIIPDVAVIVGVHCHVNLETILKSIKAYKHLYAIMMPCCMKLVSEEQRKWIIHEYHDEGIPSPHNKIYILDLPYNRLRDND